MCCTHHDAHDVGARLLAELLGDAVGHERLLLVVLLAVAVRAVTCTEDQPLACRAANEHNTPVDHDLVGELGLPQPLGRLLDVLGRVVRAAVRAAEDDMASRVTVGLDDCEVDKEVRLGAESEETNK